VRRSQEAGARAVLAARVKCAGTDRHRVSDADAADCRRSGVHPVRWPGAPVGFCGERAGARGDVAAAVMAWLLIRLSGGARPLSNRISYRPVAEMPDAYARDRGIHALNTSARAERPGAIPLARDCVRRLARPRTGSSRHRPGASISPCPFPSCSRVSNTIFTARSSSGYFLCAAIMTLHPSRNHGLRGSRGDPR
jgi:hypothetical protein